MHQTRNELDCSHKCLSKPKCASFNFEIKQSRSLSTCELNNLSRMSSNNKLQSRDGFAYYEPLIPRERSKQEITAITPTTTNVITATVTTQEVRPTQAEAAIIPSSVPSATQPATTAAPGKWFAKLKGTHSNLLPLIESCWSIFLESFPATVIFTTEDLFGCSETLHLWHSEFWLLKDH